MKHGNGKFVDAYGTIFQGEFQNDSLNGYGIVKFKNGSSYEGYYEHGLFNGNISILGQEATEFTFTYTGGIVNDNTYFRIISNESQTYFEGSLVVSENKASGKFVSPYLVYEGEFLLSLPDPTPDNLDPDYFLYYNNSTESHSSQFSKVKGLFLFIFHGLGVLRINNQKYIGEFSNGFVEGFGYWTTLIPPDSNDQPQILRTKGMFWKGFPHGDIVRVYSNGVGYKGQMFLGKRHGTGTEIDISQNYIYIGEWFDDMKNGNGTLTFLNGTQYQGEFSNNALNGIGKFLSHDGSTTFYGNVSNGVPQHYGAFTDSEKFYLGEFKDAKFHGNGILRKKNGENYVGEFAQGSFEGFGEYSWSNESVYVGFWKNGTMNGWGYFV